MAERLTKEYYYTWDENGTKKLNYIQKLQNKLGKLEDILEKYGIESVEELKDALENKIEDISNPFLQGYVRAFFKDRLQYVEFERDIWKRACELACEREDDCYVYDNIHRAYEFYQQAKKEGEGK